MHVRPRRIAFLLPKAVQNELFLQAVHTCTPWRDSIVWPKADVPLGFGVLGKPNGLGGPVSSPNGLGGPGNFAVLFEPNRAFKENSRPNTGGGKKL